MGFFKNVQKAVKQANKAQQQSQKARSNSAPPRPPAKQPIPNIDPADLTLPSEIATDVPGVTLKPTQCKNSIKVQIVGESYRQGNIKAIVNHVGTKKFQIYLVREPSNQHDKNAVAVQAAGVTVGYIPKPENKVWGKLVLEATERHELLWGWAQAVSRTGEVYGVFGSIFMDNLIAPNTGSIEPKELKPAALTKAIDAAIAMEDADWPNTTAQAKSLAKKGVKAAVPLYAHALWVEANSSDDNEKATWATIQDACETLFDDAEDHAFITDEHDANMDGCLSELADAVKPLQTPAT